MSVTKNLKISDKAVDKYGNEQKDKNFYGDTINVIEQFKLRPIIVGIGDVGKMHGKDEDVYKRQVYIFIIRIHNT